MPTAPAATVVVTTAPQAAVAAAPTITGFTTIWGVTINPMVIVLVLAIAFIAYVIWQGQRDGNANTFDLWDLVMDTNPDGSRRASGIKCTFQAAFIMSTWVIIDQEIKRTLTEGLFGLYMATWCASLIAKVVFDKKDPPKIGNGSKDDP